MAVDLSNVRKALIYCERCRKHTERVYVLGETITNETITCGHCGKSDQSRFKELLPR